MTVIRIDPAQLDETAALLEAGAAEYESLAASLGNADLSAMPANVAGAVGSAYGDVRATLADLTSQLGSEAQTLRFRSNTAFEDGGLASQLGVIQSALGLGSYGSYGLGGFDLGGLGAGALCACCSGLLVSAWDDEEGPALEEDVDQTGGFWTGDEGYTAVSGAWGSGVSGIDSYSTVVGGGFDPSIFGGDSSAVSTIEVGGFDPSVFGGDSSAVTTINVGGFDPSIFGDSGGGYTTVVGGGFDPSVFGGDSSAVTTINVGGFDTSVFDLGNPTDGYLALTQVIADRRQALSDQLDAIALNTAGGGYGVNDLDLTGWTSKFIRDAYTAQARADIASSPLFDPDSSKPGYEQQFGSYAYEGS